ncbi:DUF6491 family protein [Thalassotalea sp. G2M2-11]|uniref:DUF6491 family protein n=1 Tax=Thalassotalea sp. G2M2-11 TaxID=2787627 RepID=UPI0019CFF947|nr:DUF6491 family protein [Thalassotalea sp. G2M2-11]
MKYIMIIIIAITLLFGCATNRLTTEEKNTAIRDYITNHPLTSVSKITSFRFHGWQSISDDFLIISSSPKHRYLIELGGFCRDISWTQSIIINRDHSSSLYARFDSISSINAPEIECMIKTIYPLDKAQYDGIQTVIQPAETTE